MSTMQTVKTRKGELQEARRSGSSRFYSCAINIYYVHIAKTCMCTIQTVKTRDEELHEAPRPGPARLCLCTTKVDLYIYYVHNANREEPEGELQGAPSTGSARFCDIVKQINRVNQICLHVLYVIQFLMLNESNRSFLSETKYFHVWQYTN